MLNILETDIVSADQPAVTQACPSRKASSESAAPSAPDRPNPLTELKSRSKEEIDWACDLDSSMTRLQAIARIKERLGIDLRWPTTYARFLQWRQQQRIQSGLAARLETFRQFEKQSDLPASLTAIESTAAALFLEQAILQQDAALFLSLLRLRLRERSLALQEQKLALEQARLQLEAAPQPPSQTRLAPPLAEPPSEAPPVENSPSKQPKPQQKTQRPGAEPKAKSTTLRRKTPFPSPPFALKTNPPASSNHVTEDFSAVICRNCHNQ